VKHHRHLPFVAMMAAYLLVPHIESLVRQAFDWSRQRARLRGRDEHTSSSAGRLGWVLPSVLLIALTAVQYPRQAVLHVDKDYYPVEAMQFMADHDLNGKVFVSFNWAQYALAVFADGSPDSRIAFDGRFRTCYPQQVIDMYFDFILGDLPQSVRYREAASGPFDPTKALAYNDPDLVLFERKRKNCVATMEAESEDWCLLYQDELAQLWGRRSRYDNPELPDYVRPELRDISDRPQVDTVPWPAFPERKQASVKVALAR
jgi:hypothetical protein